MHQIVKLSIKDVSNYASKCHDSDWMQKFFHVQKEIISNSYVYFQNSTFFLVTRIVRFIRNSWDKSLPMCISLSIDYKENSASVYFRLQRQESIYWYLSVSWKLFEQYKEE